jgi:hypothetical protein
MDMKRILQAMDGVATKPVVGADSMAKFLSIVDKNASVQILNEATPHKVSLPVQMAMQHYQQQSVQVEKKKFTDSGIRKFFHDVEQELNEQESKQKTTHQQLIKQYSQTIAERVLMKESVVTHSHGPRFGTHGGPGMEVTPDTGGHFNLGEMPIAMDPAEPNNPLIHSHQKANPATLQDRIARTRAQLKELSQLAERNDLLAWEEICKKAQGGMFMGLEQNLEQIRHGISELARKRKQGGINSRGIDKTIGEAVMPNIAPTKPTIKAKTKTSSCRAGQTQTGMQTKDGKLVPKCSVTGIKK